MFVSLSSWVSRVGSEGPDVMEGEEGSPALRPETFVSSPLHCSLCCLSFVHTRPPVHAVVGHGPTHVGFNPRTFDSEKCVVDAISSSVSPRTGPDPGLKSYSIQECAGPDPYFCHTEHVGPRPHPPVTVNRGGWAAGPRIRLFAERVRGGPTGPSWSPPWRRWGVVHGRCIGRSDVGVPTQIDKRTVPSPLTPRFLNFFDRSLTGSVRDFGPDGRHKRDTGGARRTGLWGGDILSSVPRPVSQVPPPAFLFEVTEPPLRSDPAWVFIKVVNELAQINFCLRIYRK